MYENLEDVIKTGDKVKINKFIEDDVIIGLGPIGRVGTFVGLDIDTNSCCIYFDGIGIYYVSIDMIEKFKY